MIKRITSVEYVELFHLLFLDQLGRKIDKGRYVLKGGCNLRFFLKSIRYSQDMDFDIDSIRKETLSNALGRILESSSFNVILRSRGIELVNVSMPKQTDTTQRWKIQLKVPHSSTPVPTKIEFSRRSREETALFEPVDPVVINRYLLTPIYASHYSMQVALWQKIWALILRTETQARDIFDLNHLISMGVEIGQIPDTMRNRIPDAIANAMAITHVSFVSQVISYLPLDYQAQFRDPVLWDAMLLRVCKSLEEVL